MGGLDAVARPRALPRGIRLLLWMQGFALVGYGSMFLLPVPSLVFTREVIVMVVAEALPAVLCLYRARSLGADNRSAAGERVRGGPDGRVRALQRGYALLGAGCLAYAIADLVYGISAAYLDPVPDPYWPDICYLACYPLFAASVLVLARAELGHRLARGVWLDGLTGVFGTATLGSVLGLPEILTRLSGSPATLITDAAYPILDLLLVSTLVGAVALRGGHPGPTWWLLGGGLTIFAVGDLTYLCLAAFGISADGTPLALTWIVGLNLIALATLCRPPTAPVESGGGGAAIILPVTASVVALTVLIVGRWVPIPLYSVVLAVLTLLAALSRTAAAFRTAHLLAESHEQARTDDLTGLGNRRAFYEQARDALKRAGATGTLSVLLLDVDRFKEINDSLGHHVGDQLLCLLSARLSGSLGAEDELARLGGDEFVIVLPHTAAAEALHTATRLTTLLAVPFSLAGLDLQVTASIGVANYPDHARSVSGLLQRADVAMYRAKATRTGASVYDTARDEETCDRLSTVDQLRHALRDEQLVMHYQPQCEVRTGAVVGVEALVRWQHPERGLVPPDAFLPLVEQSGLMPALTLYVLDRSIAQCAQWRLDGIDLSVSVNLTVSDLLDERLPAQVATILARYAVPAASLLLEVTENTLMVDPNRATATLTALHDLGARLSVDDYGTGYCSLAYLRDLPVDELKLDKSFLLSASPGSRASAIVRSTIDLAHALGLRMVAEGVETAAALHLLRTDGCDIAQGYYFSRALPAEELVHWLRERSMLGQPQDRILQ